MAKRKAKYWYLAMRPYGGIVDYVIYAETMAVAQESLGCLSGEYVVVCLDWRKVSELTGCLIPVASNESEFATGDLLFNVGGKSVCIRAT